MLHQMFSFKGRMNRAPYWGYSILTAVMMVLPIFGIGFYVGFINADAAQTVIDAKLEAALKWPALIVTLLAMWPLTAIVAKRLQDHGRAGWIALPVMLPSLVYQLTVHVQGDGSAFPVNTPMLVTAGAIYAIVAIWSIVYLGCMRGTDGPNQFGPDPLEMKSMAGGTQAA